MTLQRRLSCALALCLIVSASHAEDELVRHWMAADAIRAEFSGKSLAGIYPSGVSWSEDIATDGTTDYRENQIRRPGQWWLTALEFCFSYLPPGVGGCFRVVKMSANCYEIYEFSSEFGRRDAPPRQKGAWNGRMWRTEAPTTCEEKPSV
jgi:hypothetical protein